MIVETVGTGQSETRIAALADTRVVVCPPGLGDDVQALKAGTLEIADVLAVSKGDLPLAEQTAREMREMLGLRRSPAADAWKPRVVVVRALAEGGIDGLLEALEAHALSVARPAGDCATPTARAARCPSPIRRRSRPTTPTAGAPACRRSPRATACAPRSASPCSPAARAERRWR